MARKTPRPEVSRRKFLAGVAVTGAAATAATSKAATPPVAAGRLPSAVRPTAQQVAAEAGVVKEMKPVAGRATGAAGGRGRLRTHALEHQLDDPTARLERETHPPHRAHSLTHLGLLVELGLGRPQGSPEARTQSAVSKVCG